MPLISLIVPVYNTAAFLPRCLDSILAQTQRDLEILAVNDGSTDESWAILEDYAQKFPDQIRIFQKENGGLSHTRNFAIDRARGEFLAFVDSDDYLSPDFCEKMLEKARRENLDMVLCDFYYEYDSGERRYSSIRKNLSDQPHREALLSAPMVCTRLFRRSLFDTLRFRCGILYEDLELTPATVLQTKKVGFVPEGLYFYYQRSGSIMHKKDFSEKLMDIFTVLESVYTRFKGAGKLEEYHDEIEYLYLEHLFRSAALRFAPMPNAKPLFQRIRQELVSRFPQWKKNPYLPKVSPFFRLTVFLTAGGHFRLVRILSRLKG